MREQRAKGEEHRAKAENSYEDLQEDVRLLKMPKIEVWENKYRDKDYTIFLESSEFNCICPKTGLPDFANIRIQYIPDRYCIELRSFKLYLCSFRNIGIFHEHAINKILDDFVRACNPRWANIIGEFNPRGGVKTTISRQYKAVKSH